MYTKARLFLIGFLIFGLISSAKTEQIKKVAQTSMKWLSIPIGTGATGMGTAYYCMSGSVEPGENKPHLP